MIESIKNLGYEERLKKLRLTILETRRIRLDLLEVLNIIKGFEGLKRMIFLNEVRKIV